MDEPRDATITVRSFGSVFALERRLHRIDRWRIPLPWGIPVAGLIYAVTVALSVLVVSGLPVVSTLLAALPLPVRYVLLPAAVAYLLTQVKVDGRSALVAGRAVARHLALPRWTAGWRAIPPPGEAAHYGDMTFAPDERSPRLRPARISGPCQVLVRYPARARPRGRRLVMRQTSGAPMWQGKVVALRAGEALDLR